ncbi:unnamed protein product [Mortierella alpina]
MSEISSTISGHSVVKGATCSAQFSWDTNNPLSGQPTSDYHQWIQRIASPSFCGNSKFDTLQSSTFHIVEQDKPHEIQYGDSSSASYDLCRDDVAISHITVANLFLGMAFIISSSRPRDDEEPKTNDEPSKSNEPPVGITLGDAAIGVDGRKDGSTDGGRRSLSAIMDSGTTLIVLGDNDAKEFYFRSTDATGFAQKYWSFPCTSLPEIVITLASGSRLSLPKDQTNLGVTRAMAVLVV